LPGVPIATIGGSRNGPLISVPIDVVGTSSNRTCAMCPTVAWFVDVRPSAAVVGASSNCACVTYPTVATIR
jgi:hypothetical protein